MLAGLPCTAPRLVSESRFGLTFPPDLARHSRRWPVGLGKAVAARAVGAGEGEAQFARADYVVITWRGT
jgi:hypothetical protein